MDTLKDIGNAGEDQARQFLVEKGYRLRDANFRTRWGEIDLVMEDGPTLVFVEVKRRRNDAYGSPEEAVEGIKKSHMAKAALIYVQKTGLEDRMMRFDVVTIDDSGIRHLPDAFSTDGFYYH